VQMQTGKALKLRKIHNVMTIKVICTKCGKEGILKSHNVKVGSKMYHYWYVVHSSSNDEDIHNLSNREVIIALIMYINNTNKIDDKVINGVADIIYAIRDILGYQFDIGELNQERTSAILNSLGKLEKSIKELRELIEWINKKNK